MRLANSSTRPLVGFIPRRSYRVLTLLQAISETLPTAGDKLIYERLKRGPRDNMSVLIVSLTTELDANSSSIADLTEGVGRRLKLHDEV